MYYCLLLRGQILAEIASGSVLSLFSVEWSDPGPWRPLGCVLLFPHLGCRDSAGVIHRDYNFVCSPMHSDARTQCKSSAEVTVQLQCTENNEGIWILFVLRSCCLCKRATGELCWTLDQILEQFWGSLLFYKTKATMELLEAWSLPCIGHQYPCWGKWSGFKRCWQALFFLLYFQPTTFKE